MHSPYTYHSSSFSHSLLSIFKSLQLKVKPNLPLCRKISASYCPMSLHIPTRLPEVCWPHFFSSVLLAYLPYLPFLPFILKYVCPASGTQIHRTSSSAAVHSPPWPSALACLSGMLGISFPSWPLAAVLPHTGELLHQSFRIWQWSCLGLSPEPSFLITPYFFLRCSHPLLGFSFQEEIEI